MILMIVLQAPFFLSFLSVNAEIFFINNGGASHLFFALRFVVWPCAAISLWGSAPIPRSQALTKKKVAHWPPSLTVLFSLSFCMSSFMYLPLLALVFRYSIFSMSSLNDIIFVVIRFGLLPPFLISSSFISVRQFHILSCTFARFYLP